MEKKGRWRELRKWEATWRTFLVMPMEYEVSF